VRPLTGSRHAGATRAAGPSTKSRPA